MIGNYLMQLLTAQPKHNQNTRGCVASFAGNSGLSAIRSLEMKREKIGGGEEEKISLRWPQFPLRPIFIVPRLPLELPAGKARSCGQVWIKRSGL